MEIVEIARLTNGLPIYMDKSVWQSDGSEAVVLPHVTICSDLFELKFDGMGNLKEE